MSAALALRIRGADWLDVASGETAPRDLLVDDGTLCHDDGREAVTVDAAGLTAMFGLWDCHSHPGGLMYDNAGVGFFEGLADRTIRAGENFAGAVTAGVTGVRCLDEADELDLAWGRAYAAGTSLGPRVTGAGRALRTTAGHGTCYPRHYTGMNMELVCDGPDAMAKAVRRQLERGAQWIKVMLTGGLYSPHETCDGGQFTVAELDAVMEVANLRGIPVAAHCGGAEVAIAFSERGGRSVEHGYLLNEEAAAVMAANGTWLVPTVGVTHDQEYIEAEQWPKHAAERSREVMPGHAEALKMCIAAGVRIAVGADLNPIGERLHRELEMMERAGMDRRSVLHAASVGGRQLNGFGGASAPVPGAAADLILTEENPMESLSTLRSPRLVVSHGRPAAGALATGHAH
ncbi:MAG: amidohydrolase family protein [Acidimicrobiia bacterium]|nr:amidohydrolase family protein [Acidimicrobiia bacterium]MYJ13216.1 amidohydrolase family protein [Acidimicrobiia bacterium]